MALWLDIDAHGRVAPLNDDARRVLADRAGRFTLLPAAPDLLVAHRTPPGGGSPTRPRVLVCGDLSGFPIVDFIAFIHQSRLSGVLTVAGGGAERSIAFKDGEVRNAQSTVTGERIGDVALKLGLVTEAQLAEATAGGRPIGKALVEKEVLSANDLWKCFHEQVTAVFHALLLTQEGLFWLVDEDVTDRPGAPLAVSTQSLLMDGIRRIDEMTLFKARIPGPAAFLRLREPKRPLTLKPVEYGLLKLVDGRITVAELAKAAHLNEFEAIKILYHLAEAGYVEAVADPATVVVTDPAERLRQVAAGMTDLLRLVGVAVPAKARPGFLKAVQIHLADQTVPFAPLFRDLSPGADGGLAPAELLANLELLAGPALKQLEPTGEAARLLYDALRELLFFYLFLAGERLSRDDDDALSVQVKQLLARLGELVGA